MNGAGAAAMGSPAGARAAIVRLAIVVAVTAGCMAGRSSAGAPTARPPAPTPAPATSEPPDLPALLTARAAGLDVIELGRPTQPPFLLDLPAGMSHPTAATGPHGAILLVSAEAAPAATVVEGTIAGSRVEPRWTAALPSDVGPDVQAGCVAADGSAAVIGDRLLLLRAGRVAATHDIPATAGRCQMTADGGVAYLADVDHVLTFWRPPATTAVVTSTRCDDFGLGGGVLACLQGGRQDVVVGRLVTPLGGRAVLDADAIQRLPGPARQVVLSPDGTWLALVAADMDTATIYRRAAAGAFAVVDVVGVEPGDGVLGFVEP